MDLSLVGWHDDPGGGPQVRLDYRAFAYAGKFVTSAGTALARDPSDPWELGETDGPDRIGDPTVVGAVAFNEDRTDPETLWLRYVTVREDRRGEGIGPRLVRFVCDRARDRGYAKARIAVNNVFSYEALSKVGFSYTGRETGLAEVVLDRELSDETRVDAETYQAGLDVFRERECSPAERAFLDERAGSGPPARVDGAERE